MEPMLISYHKTPRQKEYENWSVEQNIPWQRRKPYGYGKKGYIRK